MHELNTMQSGPIQPERVKEITGSKRTGRRTPAGATLSVGLLVGAVLLLAHPFAMLVVVATVAAAAWSCRRLARELADDDGRFVVQRRFDSFGNRHQGSPRGENGTDTDTDEPTHDVLR